MSQPVLIAIVIAAVLVLAHVAIFFVFLHSPGERSEDEEESADGE